MSNKLSVLFCSSEVYPFAKSGGLADVSFSLPKALGRDANVKVVLPLYKSIDRSRFNISSCDRPLSLNFGGKSYDVALFSCEYESMEYLFIYNEILCDREFLYGTPEAGYEDNALRFGIFNYAIIALLQETDYDIVHLNDWQSALAALLLKENPKIQTKSVFTIHNLAYQGIFERHTLHTLGIHEAYFNMDALEFYNQVSFMKAGIAFSDALTTVSPTYAKEILTPEFGNGLEGFLLLHKVKLKGIINGLDQEHFSPKNDRLILQPYTNLTQKLVNKKAYLKEIKRKGIKKPLFVFIGRFTSQKGMDLLIDSLSEFAKNECNIAILGEGEAEYCEALNAVAKEHKNIHLSFGYDEALSHRMYAAADFLLMPSLFEPCGLNQLIAMSYGQLPIVHRVGGLADTVHNYKKYDAKSSQGYGIDFKEASKRAFIKAFHEALKLYSDKKSYNKIAKHNMNCDFSWKRSAQLYIQIYIALVKGGK